MLRFLRMGNKRTKTIWWILIIVTVVTFVGGFVFLFGAGLDSGTRARAGGAVGTVNGTPIPREAYASALAEQRAAYSRQYGADPTDRDAQMVEIQTWRGLVTQQLLADQARKLGLKATDREVVLSLQSSPPAVLANSPSFQTDGKFDPQKYAAAMRDPGNNWAGFEAIVREQLPVRKLQERLMASLKLSQPELEQTFRDRFERLSATIAMVPASNDTGIPAPTDAGLQRVYEKYKTRFTAPARTQLEMLIVPKKVGDAEVKVAQEAATSYVERARRGEDFAALVRDYSEGPAINKGGEVDRTFTVADFGPVFGPRMMTMNKGDISDPMREGMRFIVFKVLDKTPGAGGLPTFRVAELVVRVRPSETALADQMQQLEKIQKRAGTIGLGKAAVEGGMVTTRSDFYDATNAPPQLFGVPAAGDWALTAKQGAVSPVFAGLDEYAVVEVASQQPAGVMPKSEITDALRQLADFDARVDRARPRADAIATAIASGKSLEAAASASGVSTFTIENTTRRQPDPRIASAPELVGALFGAGPGKTVGPVRGLNGWYFGRTTSITPADTSQFNAMKGQLTTEILNQRQQAFFNDYIMNLRSKAKIEDLRSTDN